MGVWDFGIKAGFCVLGVQSRAMDDWWAIL